MFGTAAITPGFANIRQNGTLPSAKSNQYGALPGRAHSCRSGGGVVGTGSALARVVPASTATEIASKTPAFLTTLNSSPEAGRTRPPFTDCLRLAVERRVHFRDLLGLAGLVRRRRVRAWLAAEVDLE